jgi:hypothetical protein
MNMNTNGVLMTIVLVLLAIALVVWLVHAL